MDKRVYIKWYRIAQEVVKSTALIPSRTDEEIMDFVSPKGWFMFAPNWIKTRKEVEEKGIPNVFLHIYDEKIKKNLHMGVAFDTLPAVNKLKNILSTYCQKEKEQLTKKLLSLDNVWNIAVNRKIKDKCPLESPKYKPEYTVKSNEINDKIVDKIINTINLIREEGKNKALEVKAKTGKVYREFPATDLIECWIELDEQEFKKRIKDAFDVLAICLNVKTDSEIQKLDKEKKKREKIDKEIEEILGGF